MGVAKSHLRLIHGGKREDLKDGSPDDYTRLVDLCERLYEAVLVKDLDRVMDVWSQTGSVSAVFPGEERVMGWSAVRAGWARLFDEAEAVRVSPGGYLAHISGQVAIMGVVEITTLWPVGGGDPMQAPIVATMVFKRGDGEIWELVHRHASVFGVGGPPDVNEKVA